jgi:hypothetical protein
MLADAFQLVGAAPDASRLAEYSDGGALFGRYRAAAAALTAGAFVRGRGGRLHSDEHMTLAEFLTILYRIVPNFRLAAPSESLPQAALFFQTESCPEKNFRTPYISIAPSRIFPCKTSRRHASSCAAAISR